MASKNIRGTLVQLYLDENEIEKLNELAKVVGGGMRTRAIKYVLAHTSVDVKLKEVE